MARYKADSTQVLFISGTLDDLLPSTSIARLIWQGVSSLDFSGFDAQYCNDEEGRPALDPRRLAGLWILGLMRRVTSSVELARLSSTDIEFRWLSGDSSVKKSTLSDFRSGNLAELSDLSSQVLACLSRSGNLPAQDLAIDSTVIRAASSLDSITTPGKLRDRLARLRDEIRQKLSAVEGDSDEVSDGTALLQQRSRLQAALEEMNRLGLGAHKRVSLSEPDVSVKRLKKGSSAPAHNLQGVTDLASGALIHVAVVDRNNDQRLLLPLLESARRGLQEIEEKLGVVGSLSSRLRSVTADSGYHDTRQLVELESKGIMTYVADDRIRHWRPPGVAVDYLAEKFAYSPPTDTMICPRGHHLRRRKYNRDRTAISYQGDTLVCRDCPAKIACCPRSSSGRSVNRPLYAEALARVAQRVSSAQGVKQFRARKVTMEGCFARLCELLNWRRCRCWGKSGASAEALWRQLTHNLMLMIGHWKPLVLNQALPG